MLISLTVAFFGLVLIIVGSIITSHSSWSSTWNDVGILMVCIGSVVILVGLCMCAVTMANCITTTGERIKMDTWYEEIVNEINLYHENPGDYYDVHALNADIITFNQNVALANHRKYSFWLVGFIDTYYSDYEPLTLVMTYD